MITKEQIERWWDNLADDGKQQAINVLILYPETRVGDAKAYIIQQIKEFDKFYKKPMEG